MKADREGRTHHRRRGHQILKPVPRLGGNRRQGVDTRQPATVMGKGQTSACRQPMAYGPAVMRQKDIGPFDPRRDARRKKPGPAIQCRAPLAKTR